MDQNEFGKLIKEIRKKNNLTQKDLADKYNVTYQAVSKWENGKNMPDVSLIKEISKDFNVSMDDLLEGKYIDNKKQKIIKVSAIIVGIVIILGLLLFVILNKKSDFSFKTLSTNCDNFTLQGSISYNDKKSAIYISNIEYCGEEDSTIYKSIKCTLYESDNKINAYVSSYEKDNVILKDFLKNMILSTDNYAKMCKNYTENSLYLEIECTNNSDKVVTYKVPLKLNDDCD